eukprot:CAMPEP_0113847274 /NCGR_PEP_ID=MMETSP0372-20130328/1778_1 /TAXON_ID=340204 /ORGANISM="Lankesteria abbotti" /LENGTH=93 /DNA_ID=CAMNT_0000816523 /DNA_START=89 /DNA_END=370 /DNA_ORIENTATION=+ /assembly_acc=CAM_ASM_000359
MTFPDSVTLLYGEDKDFYKQIGNAVPPALSCAIASMIPPPTDSVPIVSNTTNIQDVFVQHKMTNTQLKRKRKTKSTAKTVTGKRPIQKRTSKV